MLKLKVKDSRNLEPVILKVLDSLDFKERWEKRRRYKALREAFDEIKEEQKAIFNKYVDKKTRKVPEDRLEEANTEFNEFQEQVIDVEDVKLKFSYDEVKKADLKMAELDVLDEYGFLINEKPKKKKAKEEEK